MRTSQISGPSGDKHKVVDTTRAALIALRNAGNLDLSCTYRFPITQATGNGQIYMLPLATDLLPTNVDWEDPAVSNGAAWSAEYDIDADDLHYLHDTDRNNEVYEEAAINAFPWGVGAVTNNRVHQGRVNYTAGTFDGNIIESAATVNINGGTTRDNHFKSQSNFTISGGSFNESDVGQDADVTIIAGSNYENVFGASVLYRQVGTGYIRYSTFEGTTTITQGNTNFSNCTLYTCTINTTGSTGTISNSIFNRFYGVNLQNIPTLTIADSTLKDYTSATANGALRLYIYRSSFSGASRLLVTAGARLDLSYCEGNSYGYFQVTAGVLLVTYTTVKGYGYVRHDSTGTNNVSRATASNAGYIRFQNTTTGCRVYYSSANAGGKIRFTGTSTNSYFYYCSANSNSTMISTNSVNGRYYYNTSEANANITATNNSATHYIYYCSALSQGAVELINNTGDVRMYSVTGTGRGRCRIQNTVAGRIFYSSFHAYYYLYATFSVAATRQSLHGYGRLTNTITDIPTNGTSVDNF